MKNTVWLAGTVVATYGVTMCSKRIGFAFRLLKVRIYFPIGSNVELMIYPLVGTDNVTTINVKPTGRYLLSILGNQEGIAGSGEVLEFDYDIEVKERGSFLKAYCKNNSAVDDHRARIEFVIESIEEKKE